MWTYFTKFLKTIKFKDLFIFLYAYRKYVHVGVQHYSYQIPFNYQLINVFILLLLNISFCIGIMHTLKK